MSNIYLGDNALGTVAVDLTYTCDPIPVQGSTNAVQSGGVYDALNTHNADSSAHSDIRTLVDNATSAASAAQTTANEAKDIANEVKNAQNQTDSVGTIKYTIREDMGEDWLLCNGAYFAASTYPELGQLVPKDFTGTWDYVGDDECPISGPLYKMNGYYIRWDSSKVCYSTKWPCTASDWTTLDNDTYFSGWTINSFDYAGGKWIVGLYYSSANPSSYAVSNTSAINGTYTKTNFSTDLGTCNLGHVFEYGGVAYAIGLYSSSWQLRKLSGTTFSDFSSCTNLQSNSSTNQTRYWSKMIMHNNILYAVHHNKASNDSNYYIRGQVSTDGGKNWTDLKATQDTSAQSCNCFVVGENVYASLSNGNIYKINSTTGEPTKVGASGVIKQGYNVIEKDGNVLYAHNTSTLYISNSSLSSSSASSTTATDVAIGDDGQMYALNGTKYYYSSGTKVPSITVSGCNAYIRAK